MKKRISTQPSLFLLALGFAIVASLSHCGSTSETDGASSGNPPTPSESVTCNNGSDAYCITSPSQLIGGPLADGQVGDIYIQNDKVRLIIQNPDHNSASFGGDVPGTIIDMDIRRPTGETGQDNLTRVFPLYNMEWSAQYRNLEIVENDLDDDGLVHVRATGNFKVQEYLPPSLIIAGTKSAGVEGAVYPERFQNALDPLNLDPTLSQLSLNITTDYILRRGSTFVEMRTTIKNEGTTAVPFPIGDWVSAAGELEFLVPNRRFVNPFLDFETAGDMPGVVYGPLRPGVTTDTNVSYAYVQDLNPFKAIDSSATFSNEVMIQGVTVSVAGQMAFRLSEDGPGLIPLCGENCEDSKILAALPPGTFTYSTYIAAGNADMGTALSGAYDAVGVNTTAVSGQVVDLQGNPIANAKVIFLGTAGDSTFTSAVFLSQADGTFSGKVAVGGDWTTDRFGNGTYKIEVYKEGYAQVGDTGKAGYCSPTTTDVRGGRTAPYVTCVLGETRTVTLSDIVDVDTGENIPAIVHLIGADPSPKTDRYGDPGFYSTTATSSLLGRLVTGIIDTFYYHPDGTYTSYRHPVENKKTIRLEPGKYALVFNRGNEYSMVAKPIDTTTSNVTVGGVGLSREIHSTGYVSMDFHIHTRNSVDVPVPQELRALNAAAAGLDIGVTTDHDIVTGMKDAIVSAKTEEYGAWWSGQEITPLALGHFLAANLPYDATRPFDGGAIDLANDPRDPQPTDPAEKQVGRDYNLPVKSIFEKVHEKAGEQVIFVAHTHDTMLGSMKQSGLVTSIDFQDLAGVNPFETYGNPVDFRLGDAEDGGAPHAAFSTEDFDIGFDGMEIADLWYDNTMLSHSLSVSIPTAFNLLNLGKPSTMVMDTDVHNPFEDPIGGVVNYCRSPVDPDDVPGDSFTDLMATSVADALARNIKNQHCFISGGPYLEVTLAQGANSASFGDTLSLTSGQNATLSIRVTAPKWVEWDEILVYINTEPTPIVTDEEGATISTEEFHRETSHYDMAPTYRFSTQNHTLEVGVSGERRASLTTKTISFPKDSWIVVLVRGTDGVSNAVYPLNPRALNESVTDKELADLVVKRIEQDGDLSGGIPAFAIGNAILVDADNDDLWTAIHIADGTSPLAE